MKNNTANKNEFTSTVNAKAKLVRISVLLGALLVIVSAATMLYGCGSDQDNSLAIIQGSDS